MMFPNERIIYEIPIYSMPQKEFDCRWNKIKSDLIDFAKERGNSKEKINEMLYYLYYPKFVWKYNQIVGFVEIAISLKDIAFCMHRTLDKKMYAQSKRKHFIQELQKNNMHFPIGKKTNEEILIKIEECLSILQQGLPGKMCLYLDTFNNVKKNIDFLAIHKEYFSLK